MSDGVKAGRAGWVIWLALGLAVIFPIVLAAQSPLLAWRGPVYIMAGFAGVAGLVLLLVQPLLAVGMLPGQGLRFQRQLHQWAGAGSVLAVVLHVAGLWLTSPPDVVDVLLVRSPTPFAIWGLIAMWAIFATACLALFRRRLGIGWRGWRVAHSVLAILIVGGTVAHALLVDGTMEVVSKWALCALVVLVAIRALADPAALARLLRR